ncbi:hypothetical protein [Piscinibacter sp.]|uniref:hypothetical protein n=1 Tax=Piscinibacter sp. TaxID=1903157 RepID=UPI002BDC7518|nr:hypothetical protein [Albitalea sp.]HUG23486.1 hypothetical protein [Albitalea sp.]
MQRLWLLDFSWSADGASPLRIPAPVNDLSLWQSEDGQWGRAYARVDAMPGVGWELLNRLQHLDGASAGQAPACHYVVETDVAAEHERDFNVWYEQEHLPGLAAVPGTISASRYRRTSGHPCYLACYDLTTPATLQRPEWLAVRHTDWSSRIRPLFRNTRRTMFHRPPAGREPAR